jgi:WD40 repeat protein
MRSAAKLLVIVLLIAHPIAVYAGQGRVVRSPDGVTFAIAQWDCKIELANTNSNRITLYEPHPDCSPDEALGQTASVGDTRMSFSPDGSLLATQVRWGALDLWDAQSGRKLASFEPYGAVDAMKLSSDSRLILAVAKSLGHKDFRTDSITVWEVATRKQVFHTREGDNAEFNNVAVSPGFKMVMALVGPRRGQPEMAKLWDIETGRELVALKGQFAEFALGGEFLPVTEPESHLTHRDIRDGMKPKPLGPLYPKANYVRQKPVSKPIPIAPPAPLPMPLHSPSDK